MSKPACVSILLCLLLATSQSFQDLITDPDSKIITVSFPEDQSTDTKPCFKFSGQVHFIVSYAIKDASRPSGQREKMVQFDLPPVSQDMISGSCASPSFTYISSTFRVDAERDFNCRMDVNFTLQQQQNNINDSNKDFDNNTTTGALVNSVPAVFLNKIQLECDIKEALNSVKATFETPVELNPANTSLQCDSAVKFDLSPSIMVSFKSLKLQAFNLPPSGDFSPASRCYADMDIIAASNPAAIVKQDSSLSTSPAPSITTSPVIAADESNKDIESVRSLTTSSPVMAQTTKLPFAPGSLANQSDVKLLFSPEAPHESLKIDPTYIELHGDPAVNGKSYTDTTTETSTVPISTTTKSPTTTISTSTTESPTSSQSPTPKTSPAPSTPTPTTTTPTPGTVPPNVVPPVGHWTLNRSRADGSPSNQTCLILEMSVVMDITYLAAFPKPNSTVVEYKNKTVKMALPPQPYTQASGSCFKSEQLFSLFPTPRTQMIALQFNVTSHPWTLVLEFLDAPLNKTWSAARTIRDLTRLLSFKNKGNASNSSTVDPGHYVLDGVRLHYDTHSFTDAVNQEKFELAVSGIKMFNAKDGKATICSSEQKIVLSPLVSLRTYNFKARPFITNPNQTTFGEAELCAADRLTSDVVPIAVGCALAALIVVVLIAYAIGRYRRRRQGYQTVE